MAGFGDYLGNAFSQFYNWTASLFPKEMEYAVLIFFYAILISIVAVFIWHFYKSLSRRNLIQLNLNQYNKTNHPVGFKLVAIFLYFLEYIIIMPLIILVWFAALSVVMLVIADTNAVSNILIMTAAMVTAVRILAYHKHEVAQDLAKLFPFITLSVFILSPGGLKIENVTSGLNNIPVLLNSVLQFVLVIFIVEIVLRIFYTILLFWKSEEELKKMEMERPF